MDIRAVETDALTLARYEALFQKCFPRAKHLNARYLNWLYVHNPVGKAIGYDAWEGGALVAHYACIPVEAIIAGKLLKVMLSLNTATHPDFRGKGLFTRLAETTYQTGAEMGMAAVYGVANANSTPGFIRKLGFTLVKPLDACVGFGRIDAASGNVAEAEFRRDWSRSVLKWRISNPERPVTLVEIDESTVGTEAFTGTIGLRAWDEVQVPTGMDVPSVSPTRVARVHLGLRPGDNKKKGLWFDIPQRFRPSPLNMIFKSLAEDVAVPAADSIRLGQLDFDAF